MIKYVTGNLLDASTEALVNTVNCEGYMGKGIAYQFKLKYPLNNKDYIKACKNGELTIGKLHYFKENEKIIINFPTKDKWRMKSKMEYIDLGLDELIKLIYSLNIKSISIPPLGSGNGGLKWNEVKELIESKLSNIPDVDIYIYEPIKNYTTKPVQSPKLSASALVLMKLKMNLKSFDRLRLQKTAYFLNVFAEQEYFKFKEYKYGPYSHPIDIVSRSVKEFQLYHDIKDIDKSYELAYNMFISKRVVNTLTTLEDSIIKATSFVNMISSNHELECLSTIVYLVQKNNILTEEQIIEGFNNWSWNKKERFNHSEIILGIEKLYNIGIFENNLIGYSINQNIKNIKF